MAQVIRALRLLVCGKMAVAQTALTCAVNMIKISIKNT